jgi:hypothetical protein
MGSQLSFASFPALLVITGSRLYGTARYDAAGNCVSDTDYRGFVLPPLDYLLGLQTFNETSFEGDHKVWSLRNFFDMLLKGNAQALECLFAPPSHVVACTPLGQHVLGMRSSFLGKHYYKSISGFAYSEWRKVRGVKLVVAERAKSEDDVVQDILNVFPHLPKDVKDQIIELLYSCHEKREVSSKSDVGVKRREEYDRYGYGASSASHALRLLGQCHELLTYGYLSFPAPTPRCSRRLSGGNCRSKRSRKSTRIWSRRSTAPTSRLRCPPAPTPRWSGTNTATSSTTTSPPRWSH